MMPVVEAIFTTSSAGEPMVRHERIEAIAGKGLSGDRYERGTGFYSDGQDGRQLTLIERKTSNSSTQAGSS